MLKRVAIVFSGGPAPAANSVISSAASALIRQGVTVYGILHGYSGLQEFEAESRPLEEGRDYRIMTARELRGLRNSRGITLGTARANPGRSITRVEDFADPEKTGSIDRVYRALVDLEIDFPCIWERFWIHRQNFSYLFVMKHVGF